MSSHVFIGAVAALPRYNLGAVVSYRDHQNRYQSGKVLRVDAHWMGAPDHAPLIVYTIRHPTYRNRKMYAGEDVIIGLSNTGGERP